MQWGKTGIIVLMVAACILAAGMVYAYTNLKEEVSTVTSETVDLSAVFADASEAFPADLQIHAFSAGKADAFLLTTPNSAVLIDAGEKGFGKTILSYLEEKGITRLDCMIITHFDKDHVGGAAKVINQIEIGTVLQSNSPKASSEYNKYIKALRSASMEPVTVTSTVSFSLDGVMYTVDPPRRTTYSSDASNNSSMIISVFNGNNSFLFTGDAQSERLEEFLDANDTSYDVLKVPHHGQEEPLFEALLDSVWPTYAIITSSDDEPEDESVTAALDNAGVQTYYTRLGAVDISSDGTDLQTGYADGI